MQRKVYAGNKAHAAKGNFDYIFLLMISLFMLVVPFYRGLFFRVNYIPAIAIVSLIFVAFLVYKLKDKNYRVIDTYMDLSVLLIPVAYLISFFFAVNAKDAFDMVLLYSSYFMMYKVASDLSAKDERYKAFLINVIIASAFILSFTAMLSITGLFSLKGVYIGKRIYGLYQYPNTTASVLGVGIVLSLNKLIGETSTKQEIFYQIALTAMMSSFIFTLSRGGYLVLIGTLLLNFVLLSARQKLKFISAIFVSFISNIALIFNYYTVSEENLSSIWAYYLISLGISAVLAYTASYLSKKIKVRSSDRLINISLITITVIFCAIVFSLFTAKEPLEYRIEHINGEENSWKYSSIILDEFEPDTTYNLEFDVKSSQNSENNYRVLIRSYNSANVQTDIYKEGSQIGTDTVHKAVEFKTLADTQRVRIILYNYQANSFTLYRNIEIKDSSNILIRRMERPKYIPDILTKRLSEISFETSSVSSRLIFSRDGLRILMDHPIVGNGGGGWKNLYRQYQSAPYNSTEVHNFYIQYGIEVGILGLIFLLAVIVLMVVSTIKSVRSNSIYLFTYIAIFLLLVHSSIDFNLSLAAVGYMLWILVGIASSEGKAPIMPEYKSILRKMPLIVLSAVILIAAIAVSYGMSLGNRAVVETSENKNIDKAISLYEDAMIYDKYNGAYRIDMAQLMSNKLKQSKDKSYIPIITEQISLVRRYEPHNHQYTSTICNLYLGIGKFEEALEAADTKLREEPFLVQSYMLSIDINYELANYYLKNNMVQEAMPCLEKAIEVKQELEKCNMGLKKPLKLEGNYEKKLEAIKRTYEMIKSDQKQ